MPPAFAALFSGLLFGAGLIISGMTLPAKVIGFLNVAGSWDPSLGLVMLGAIAVYSPLYHRLFVRDASPSSIASLLPESHADLRLIVGSILFGAGWGISGFCPGPAIVSTASGTLHALAFTASMLLGMGAYHAFARTLR